MKKIIPVKRKVLVELVEPKNLTAGGLHLVQPVDDKLYGKVLGLGKEAFKETGEVKRCDTVVFLKHHGDPVDLNGRKCKLLDEATILAVVQE